MDKVYSQDKNFYYEIYEKNNLYRIKYFLNIAQNQNNPEFVTICGTNSSLFDEIGLAQKEGNRMLNKYQSNPELFK